MAHPQPECYSVIKGNELLIQAVTCINLKYILLNESIQSENGITVHDPIYMTLWKTHTKKVDVENKKQEVWSGEKVD